MTFDQTCAAYAASVEKALELYLPLPRDAWPAEGIPSALAESMRYSLLAGGKRLRPVLLLASHGILQGEETPALPFAAAIEMIHTYSLIHDDLPAMDNDDLRRGRPTSHKAFGEAAAILAGDALLNLAYEVMARSKHPRAIEALAVIAGAAGSSGMIAGQSADIWMESRTPDAGMLAYIHRHKTAGLIAAPVVAGLILAGADDLLIERGREYGLRLGLAFQIVDDLLDEMGDEGKVGKRLRKDRSLGKLTWPGIYGIEGARQEARAQINLALEALAPFGEKAEFLAALAQNSLTRVV